MIDRIVGSRLADIAAVGLLLAGSLAVHAPAIAYGLIPVQDDVRVHYFPLLVATAQALSKGQLPLWTPAIFGGYPLFADGEAGMLYPLHLLTLPWLPYASSLVVLRVAHSFLAGLFAFLLVRVLGAGTLGGLVAGVAFAFSGFAAGQVVHANVFQAMVWLPLELLLAERALASVGRGRFGYALLAGSIFGVQALALHVQVTLMSALAVGTFVLTRGVQNSLRGPEHPSTPESDATGLGARARSAIVHLATGAIRGVGGAIGVLAIVGLVGVGLGAVQLFPLYELAGLTYRGAGLSPEASAANSVWSGSLLTLLLPNLYDTPAGGYWGPWVKWETVIYVGILPLLLAIVGVLARAGRSWGFFLALGICALLLALGSYAPIPLWTALHAVPGFGGLQAPGRFALLFTLAVAVLAGYAVDWLTRRAHARAFSSGRGGACPLPPGDRTQDRAAEDKPPPYRNDGTDAMVSSPLAPAPRREWIAIAVVGLAAVFALALGMEHFAAVLRTGSSLPDQYLALPGVPGLVDGSPLTADRVRDFAAGALTVANETTRRQASVLLLSVVLIGVWLAFGAGTRRRSVGACSAGVAVAVVFLDLWVMTLAFHPLGPIEDPSLRLPPVLADAARSPVLGRLYTPRSADAKVAAVEPNRLLASGIQEAGGYSSLAMDRHVAFSRAVNYSDNHLLDLWNVRYLVQRRGPHLLPSYRGTVFHPERPLLAGKWATPGAKGAFRPEGGPLEAAEVHLVGSLWEAADVVEGSRVARVVVEGPEGETRSLAVRAGRHLSDATMDLPGTDETFRHSRADVAFRYQAMDPGAERYGEQLYLARLFLNPPMTVSRVTVEKTGRAGGLEVFGLGLVHASTGEVTQVRDKEKYRLVHQDERIRIFENAAFMPRAFLVRETWQAPKGSDVLALMLDGPFDPRLAAIVECDPPLASCGSLPAGSVGVQNGSPLPGDAGRATIVSYTDGEVAVHTASDIATTLVLTDTYFPGWKVFVDGQSVPLLRADYLFRGVPLPAGEHSVRFSYEPTSVVLGAVTTLLSWGVVSSVAALWAVQAVRRRWSDRAGAWWPRGMALARPSLRGSLAAGEPARPATTDVTEG